MFEQKLKILIVEDSTLLADLLKQLIKKLGHQVVGMAEDGQKAIDLVVELEPDAVLMDIEMPVVDGLTATQRIQEIRPTPVVVLTAHDELVLAEKASKVGVGAYVTKPASPDALARAFTIAVARHGDLMKLRRLVEELEKQRNELQKALEENKALRGIIPICSYCKKMRDDDGYWQQVEAYLSNLSDVSFTHGMCPECFEAVKKKHRI